MRRKIIVLMLLIVMVSSFSAYAEETNNTVDTSYISKKGYPCDTGKAIGKLSRGLTNIVTSPGEYFYQIPPSMEKTPDVMTGFFTDIFWGTIYMFRRLGSGVYDVFTSPFPGKTNYRSSIEPETILLPVGDFLTK
ncbi:MAG TPA: hypothetical protein PLO78_05840 [Candidatus Omnitrophota bacterium]|nr:hypothetical protein [Candidatus Omnitrophota bacterium]